MSRPDIPSFMFHIPRSGKLINFDELERVVNLGKRLPETIDVIDCDTHKRLQAIAPADALKKYG
jgi:hypothetical protein